MPRSAKRKPNELTIDQWLAELASASVQTPSGMSVTEMVAHLGRSREKVHKLLKEARRQGRLWRGRVQVESLDGAMRWVPVYRIMKGK